MTILNRRMTRFDAAFWLCAIPIYLSAAAIYTILANGRFTWLPFILTAWLGTAPIVAFGYTMSFKPASLVLKNITLLCLSPIILRFLSLLIADFGFNRAANILFAMRYSLIIIVVTILAIKAFCLGPRSSGFGEVTDEDLDMRA